MLGGIALTAGIALAVFAVTCAMLGTLDRAAGLGDGPSWWLDFERQLAAYLRQRPDNGDDG